MRVLVTGSREIPDKSRVWRELDRAFAGRFSGMHPISEQFVVIHGAAVGADTFAGEWARQRATGFPTVVVEEAHPANWGRYGNLAGPIRNGEMVRSGVDLVLGFLWHRSRNVGTRNCLEQAHTWLWWKGVPIKEFWE